MAYQNEDRERFRGWNHEPDPDLAEDELTAIAGSKESFLLELVTLFARNPETDVGELAGVIEDWFDDNLGDKWSKNLDVSGSLTHRGHIPTFSEIAAKNGTKLPFTMGTIQSNLVKQPLPNVAMSGFNTGRAIREEEAALDFLINKKEDKA